MDDIIHRDFDIALTSGMIGIDFDDGYDFSSFTTIELRAMFPKVMEFSREFIEELESRGQE